MGGMAGATVGAGHRRRGRVGPVPDLSRLRAEGGVARVNAAPASPGQRAWLATGYGEVRRILGDSAGFGVLPRSSRGGNTPSPPQPGNLLEHDPPEHTRLRRLLAPEFTVRRMRRLEPLIEAIVGESLDAMECAGPGVDLMRQFAQPIPALAICELLGVPRDDRA